MVLKKDDVCLRVGILGCGPIAQFAHLEAVQKGRNVTLAAVCDADPDLAARYGAFYDAGKIYTDFDALLADPQVEAVVIATADAFHVPAALRALAAGKHVLCEKPLGTTVAEVESLREAVTASGRVLQVGHMMRFDAGIQAARQFILGEIGQVLALKAWYCDSTHRYTITDAVQPMPRSGRQARRPAQDPKADRPRYNMLAHGSHLVDLARYLCGPLLSVSARFRESAGAMTWFVDVEFASGALGHLDLTVPVRMDWHQGFQLYGERGSIVAKIEQPWYFKTSTVDIFREDNATTHRVLGADGHFFRRQMEGFADVILTGAAMNGASVDDGVASVRAMAAILESVQRGCPVDLARVSGGL